MKKTILTLFLAILTVTAQPVRYLTNLTQLATRALPSDSPALWVGGYGLFAVTNSGSTLTTNLSTVASTYTNAPSGNWYWVKESQIVTNQTALLTVNSVSARTFGAVLDGVTEDQAAIQAGFNYLATNGSGGTLVIDGPALIGTNLVGTLNPVTGSTQWVCVMMIQNTDLDLRRGSLTLVDNGNCVLFGNNVRGDYCAGGTNLAVIGGIIEGNEFNQTKAEWGGTIGDLTNTYLRLAWFGGVKNLTINGTTFRNGKVWGLAVDASENVIIQNCIAWWDHSINLANPHNHDGFHFRGSINNLIFENCRLHNADDNGFALNTDETYYELHDVCPNTPHPETFTTDTSEGAITGVKVNGIWFDNCGQGFGLWGFGYGNSILADVEFSNIRGYCGISPNVCNGVYLRNFRIKNYHIANQGGLRLRDSSTPPVGRITLEELHFEDVINDNMKIPLWLRCEEATVRGVYWDSEGPYKSPAPALIAPYDIKRMSLRDVFVSGADGTNPCTNLFGINKQIGSGAYGYAWPTNFASATNILASGIFGIPLTNAFEAGVTVVNTNGDYFTGPDLQ